MPEVRGGNVRFTTGELDTLTRATLGMQLVERNGWLYLVSPFNQDPWKSFDPAPPKPQPLALPDGFVEAFGKEDDYVEQADRDTWRQYLGLWSHAGASATQGQRLGAEAAARKYGLGDPVGYALTNGAEYVAFPMAHSKSKERVVGFRLPAPLFYGFPEYAIANYQALLLQAGLNIMEFELVPFLDPNRIGHRG